MTLRLAACSSIGCISTHTLTWSVTELRQYTLYVRYISTHTLTWSVTCRGLTSAHLRANFNSHAHVERDMSCTFIAAPLDYFNSHAHVERDNSASCSGVSFSISTHTLTWSVTLFFVHKDNIHYISTHTLTWSVTTSHKISFRRFSFQLTRSRGA